MIGIASSSTALRQGRAGSRVSYAAWPAVLAATAVAGAVGSIAVGALTRPPAGLDGHLALLLHFMAALKAATALGALGLLSWRVRSPVATLSAVGYLAAFALMAVAPGLIWSLAHVAAGAVCFHVGLFAFLGLALRDDAVGPHLLSRRR